jgi:shikimate dehydrogenase
MKNYFDNKPRSSNFFCVVGMPIAHSKSPAIHSLFGKGADLELTYEKIEVSSGCLGAAIDQFRKAGGLGMNVTVPLKEEAFEIADERSDRAMGAGAANTLSFKEGKILADNTDGSGIVRDLKLNNSIILEGKTILVLGAGGAAKGIIPALIKENPSSINVSNRTTSRAEALVEFMSDYPLEVLEWGANLSCQPDIVINATSLSLSNNLPDLGRQVIGFGSVVYDMAYTVGPTRFMRFSDSLGAAQVLDGLGMLVEQAAEAFFLWHGVFPETSSVIEYLRNGGGANI